MVEIQCYELHRSVQHQECALVNDNALILVLTSQRMHYTEAIHVCGRRSMYRATLCFLSSVKLNNSPFT